MDALWVYQFSYKFKQCLWLDLLLNEMLGEVIFIKVLGCQIDKTHLLKYAEISIYSFYKYGRIITL